MAECKDLASALKRLESAINKQNQCCNDIQKQLKNLESRIGALERNATGGKQQLTKPQDLTEIYKRLGKIEQKISLIDRWALVVDGDLRNIGKSVKAFTEEVGKTLDFLFSFLELFGTVSNLVSSIARVFRR